MIVKLLTEHHFEFLSLKVGCRGSSASTLIKLSNCRKSHAAAHNCDKELRARQLTQASPPSHQGGTML